MSGSLAGPHYYEAGSTATVTATSQAGATTNIFVKSNGSVVLQPGFEIKDGTYFKAYLGPCSSGGIPTAPRFGENHLGPDVTNIVEYDSKDQVRYRKSNTAYFATADQGIEVNITAESLLNVEAINTQNNESKILVKSVKLPQGMYKILALPQYSQFRVLLNGNPVSELKK